MNKVYSLIPIVLSLGLAAIIYPIGLIEQQEVHATLHDRISSEDVMTIAYPSTIPSDSMMTKQDNFTASKAHKDNPIQITGGPPTSLPTK